jgi:hypothetical protein
MTRIRMRPLLGLLPALALAVAACGGGGGKSDGVASLSGAGQATSTTNASSSYPRQAGLAFARCMRQHGMNMPDPKIDADERMNQQLPPGVSPDDPKFKAAQQACQKYLPNGGQPTKPNAQQLQQMLGFARCMRQHGINMPDPGPGGGIDLAGSGVSSDSPKFQAAQQACQKYLSNSSGGGK